MMMDKVILDLSIQHTYRYVGGILEGIAVVGTVGAMIIFAAKRKRGFQSSLSALDLHNTLCSVADLVLVSDCHGIIVNVNHPKSLERICKDCTLLNDFLKNIRDNADGPECMPLHLDDMNASWKGELSFPSTGEHYLLIMAPIIEKRKMTGSIVLLRDITPVRLSEKQLEMQNADLKEANERLTQYVKLSGTLEAEKKRLQLLQQIQKTLIEKIENAIRHITHIQQKECLAHVFRQDTKQLAEELRNIYHDVRAAVNQITGKEIKRV